MVSDMIKPMDLLERYKGSMLGLAVGDALGAQYEYNFPDNTVINDMPDKPLDFLEPGYWTDDTSMALCLADSLITKDGFDINDQMYRYLKWLSHGYMSPTGFAFGIGGTIMKSLDSYIDTKNPYAGPTDPNTAGNGSIMRLAPVPLVYRKDIKLAEKFAAESSKTTHQATEAMDGCRLLSVLIARILNGETKKNILFKPYNFHKPLSGKINDIALGKYKELNQKELTTTGYVVDTLNIALWAFYKTKKYKDGALLSINVGGDTDTNAAVYGQIAGAYYGYSSIPKKWRDIIPMKQQIINMSKQLFELSEVILNFKDD
jgi:ADP-ribosylglycohydrolase